MNKIKEPILKFSYDKKGHDLVLIKNHDYVDGLILFSGSSYECSKCKIQITIDGLGCFPKNYLSCDEMMIKDIIE